MDWYGIAKLLHVACVIAWLGGGLVLVVLGIAAERAKNDQDLISIVRYVAGLASGFFIPASLGAVLFGAAAALLNQSIGELWVLIGLAGFLLTFTIGFFVIRPRADRLSAMTANGGLDPAAAALGKQIMQIAKFDFAMLFVIVADMVLKPQFGDWLVPAIMALVIVGAAVLFLTRLKGATA